MKNLKTYILFCAVFLTMLPYGASAASAKPTCELEVTTPMGTVVIEDSGTILLQKGKVVEISWESENAKKASNKVGDTIPLEGSATSSPKKTTSYIYTFSSGTKKAECSVKVIVVQGGFDEKTLVTEVKKPIIRGTAVGVKSVYVTVYKKGEEKPIYTSKSIPVKKDKWNTKITKSLAKGEYEIHLLGKNAELNTITKSTLTIGKKAPTSASTFVAESVPLLIGGTVKKGASAAVAYIQVINISKATGTVESFKLQQKGLASTDTITGFTITDNKSTTNISVGSESNPIEFKDGIVTIPLNTVIAGGDMRLFTIKLQLSNSVTTNLNLGKQIKLDVTGIGTTGVEKMVLPIRGVTWTIGL
jgi:hypothetical protein